MAEKLDQLNYFQLLNLNQDANNSQIRAAFRNLAKHYHPDRLPGQEDPELKDAISMIYRRLTEAYAILRNSAWREAYIDGLAENELRLDPRKAARRVQARKEASEPGKTSQGKRHYKEALAAFGTGDYARAKSEIRSALLFERDEPGFQALLDRIEKA